MLLTSHINDLCFQNTKITICWPSKSEDFKLLYILFKRKGKCFAQNTVCTWKNVYLYVKTWTSYSLSSSVHNVYLSFWRVNQVTDSNSSGLQKRWRTADQTSLWTEFRIRTSIKNLNSCFCEKYFRISHNHKLILCYIVFLHPFSRSDQCFH